MFAAAQFYRNLFVESFTAYFNTAAYAVFVEERDTVLLLSLPPCGPTRRSGISRAFSPFSAVSRQCVLIGQQDGVFTRYPGYCFDNTRCYAEEKQPSRQ
jgi:hypothetical protein